MGTRQVWCVWTLALCAVAGYGQTQKNYKDRGEYDLYAEVAKEFAAGNYAKALAGLDNWTQKYPQSEFQDNRRILYVHACYGSNQPAKALDIGAGLLQGDPERVFDSTAERLKLLYTLSVAVQYIGEPNEAQTAAGSEAARQLTALDKGPAGMSAADWEKAQADLRKTANSALLYLALAPVVRKLKGQDCAAAETGARKAMDAFPDSAQAAWYLGSAALCVAKKQPAHVSFALYEIARAAALDPSKGMVDPKWQQTNVIPYLDKVYAQYHGPDPQGLKELQAAAVAEPFPPDGFVVKSKVQLAQEKDAEFESRNPEVALWMKLKAALLAANGEEYFASGLKDSSMPKLTGVLVGAKPECRPVELTIAVRTPDNAELQKDVTLKFEKPLAGKPALNQELRWEGVAKSFTKEPFLLTVEAEPGQLDGLKTSPCAAAVSRKR